LAEQRIKASLISSSSAVGSSENPAAADMSIDDAEVKRIVVQMIKDQQLLEGCVDRYPSLSDAVGATRILLASKG
jgi:hypothetical protein